ncbi:uncharacterized protein [Montipora foliosa]|uniref:uncharacterized protein n=1 Tax=Montipora foliosa TaxID=591990 RepID=UPI0035F1CEFF
MTLAFKFVFVVLLELCFFVEYDLAPLLYVKPIPQAEIRILGTVDSPLRLERSTSVVTESPALNSSVIETAEAKEIAQKSKGSVEESKRDVGREEILDNNGNKREKRKNKDKKSVGEERNDKANIRNISPRKTPVHSRETELKWPSGTYGLPKSVDGCPSADGFEWKTGYRFHDTEDDGTENQHSDSFHLAGEFSDVGIRHEFCIKTSEDGGGRWPDGKYCIYKKGLDCPSGLEEGFVIWDDENKDNKNSKRGELPEGLFNEDTKIFFCCSTSGSSGKEITLPNKSPFLLFAYESILCQKVKGMNVITEFIKFDDEDRGNIDYEGGEYPYGIHRDEKDHMFFLCYYTPNNKNRTVVPVPKGKATSTKYVLKAKVKQQKNAKQDKQVDKLEELEKLRNSEKMMDEFLASTAPHNKETNKNERTKTIIKTIRVPEHENTTSIVVTTAGIVLGIVILGVVVGVVVIKHVRTNQEGMKIDSLDEQTYTASISSQRGSFTTSEDEVELTEADFEDELVEDQYLPSDSELKSGLELMFLKQQRHYWTRKKNP